MAKEAAEEERKLKEEEEQKRKEEQARIDKKEEELRRRTKEQKRKDMEEQIVMTALPKEMSKQIKFTEYLQVTSFILGSCVKCIMSYCFLDGVLKDVPY